MSKDLNPLTNIKPINTQNKEPQQEAADTLVTPKSLKEAREDDIRILLSIYENSPYK